MAQKCYGLKTDVWGHFFKQKTNMKKIRLILNSIFALAAIFNILSASPAQAAISPDLDSASFEALPTDTTATSGYLNSTSTSFRVNLSLNASYTPDQIGLYLDSCLVPTDSRVYDGGTDYILSSNENTLADLKTLLGSCSLPVEGGHTIFVKAKEGLTERLLWQKIITADFTAPTGTFSASAPSWKTSLKVGDGVDLGLTSVDLDIASVSARAYGRDLLWQKVSGNFESEHIIQEGDSDEVNNFMLNNAVVSDTAGNVTDYGNLGLLTTFSIDANSPVVDLIHPKNNTYASRNMLLNYTASGYDSFKIYLDGVLQSSRTLMGLSDGEHVLKIIAMDLAGNKTQKEMTFFVDTTAPTGTISGISDINQGENLKLDGATEPGALVTAEIGENAYWVTADSNGNFSFDVGSLEVGSYDVYISFRDAYANTYRFLAGSFRILEAQAEPVKVAEAQMIVSDQPSNITFAPKKIELPPLSQGIIDNEAATTSRAKYQSYLILIAIIIFAVFLSAISYNIYSRMLTARELDTNEQAPLGEYIKEDSIMDAIKEEKKLESSQEEKKENDDLPPDEPTLRW